MGRFTTKTAALAIACGVATPVLAADLFENFFPQSEVQQAVVNPELGTGWYLRGDIGYTDSITPKDADAAPGLAKLRQIRIEETWSAGGGVGYKFNNWFRADVTADYRGPSRFSDWSSSSYDRIVAGSAEQLAGFNRERGTFATALVMANAYFDLGTWYGLTPYVGGGVGAAQRSFSRFSTQTTCLVDFCDGVSLAGALPPVYRANKSRWDFAWALMAGVSADLGSGFSLDVGYRYANLGRAESGLDQGIADPQRTRLKDIETHEVRVGVRYLIDN